MSLPDLAARNALDAEIIKPVFFVYLDIFGATVRFNTSGASITPVGTPYPEMTGHEFVGINPNFMDMSSVNQGVGGSKTLTVTLSGIPEVDADTMELINNPVNWQGRDAMVWRLIRNAQNEAQGGYHRFYTGKMMAFRHAGSAAEQTLSATIESYLAALSEASNRTYLDQDKFDPGDLSARASIAIANGNLSGNLDGTPGAYTGTGGSAWRAGMWGNVT